VHIKDGISWREHLTQLVVVTENDMHAQAARQCNFFHRADTAIDRDDEPDALAGKLLDRVQVQPIALFKAVRNIDARGGA